MTQHLRNKAVQIDDVVVGQVTEYMNLFLTELIDRSRENKPDTENELNENDIAKIVGLLLLDM